MLVKSVLIACVLSAGYVACSQRSDYVHTIKPYTKTNWGDWGEIDWCPDGTFAQTVSLKVEKYQGGNGDDTAVNSIGLKCKSPICSTTSVPEKWIYSKQSKWGTWQSEISCQYGDVIFGGQAKSEPSLDGGDDAAVINYKFACRHMNAALGLVRERLLYAEGHSWGSWDEPTVCTPGTAICGIQTQVEADGGGDVDDTALNAAKFACCSTPSC